VNCNERFAVGLKMFVNIHEIFIQRTCTQSINRRRGFSAKEILQEKIATSTLLVYIYIKTGPHYRTTYVADRKKSAEIN
jgi:hypothetical protein